MRTLARTLTLLAIALAFSLEARAGVISRDLLTAGDGLLTYDLVNQREWLDLTETVGVTLAEVMAQTGPDGFLKGFRFATLADVSELALSAEVGWMPELSFPINLEPNAAEFVELLGWVVELTGGTIPTMRIALGLIATDNTTSVPSFDDTNFYVLGAIEKVLIAGPSGPVLTDQSFGGVFTNPPLSLGSDGPPLGVGNIGPFWLYRDRAVPEPVSALLILQVGVGMVVLRRRRGRGIASGPGKRA